MDNNFKWSQREKREMEEAVARIDGGADTVEFQNVQEFIKALR